MAWVPALAGQLSKIVRRERRWISAAGKTGNRLFSTVTENEYFFLTVWE
jgi:hypothetical protein